MDLQRALVALRGGSSLARLRDRFRLLRWQVEDGLWLEALETIDPLCGQLAARGVFGGSATGWVFLARAVCHFHLGDGVRFRRSLALVLRTAWRGRWRELLSSALLVRAAELRLLRGSAGPASAAERRALDWSRSRDEIAAGRLRPAQPRQPAVGSWCRITWSLEGPPRWRSPDRGQRERLLCRWQRDPASGAGRVPAWVVPILIQIIEDRMPDESVTSRDALTRALSTLASSVREPWAKALALEAWAEAAFWVLPPPDAAPLAGAVSTRTVPPGAAERMLACARAELRHASALYRQQGWKERALRCDDRADRLGRPAAGSRVAEAMAPAALPTSAVDPRDRARFLLDRRRFQAMLDEAGFMTRDRRLVGALAPLWLLARSPLPVLILGESGTGKDVLARAVHRWSGLGGEFVPIHCGAIPRDLLESELFGHARGAFTGAAGEKPGLIEAADGGTLFLDEIGEMGPEAQMKMLRVLESGEVRRLGDLKPRRVSLRLVAATHRDLESEIASGRFRLDLFHRIRGVVVRLPPLRERPGDVPLLAARFLAEPGAASLHWRQDALARLVTFDWPGNVRELRAAVLQASHLARAIGTCEITPAMVRLGDNAPAGDFFAEVGGRAGDHGTGPREASVDARPGAEGDDCPPGTEDADAPPAHAGVELPSFGEFELDAYLESIERRLIVRALRVSDWNRTHAARALGGISRTTLLSKMKRLGVEDPIPPDRAPEPD